MRPSLREPLCRGVVEQIGNVTAGTAVPRKGIEMSKATVTVKVMDNHRNDADIARENGWIPGTQLVGDEGYGPTVIEITAVGETHVLAKTISHDGKPPEWSDTEACWTFSCRDWKRVN